MVKSLTGARKNKKSIAGKRESSSKKPKTSKQGKTSLKGKCKTVHADDAIEDITMNPDGSVSLTMAPGWNYVLPKTFEDDPACLIMWDHDNCMATVAAFNVAIDAGAEPPAWFRVAGGHMTLPGLQAALLMHVQERAGGGGVVGNALIAPNTTVQYGRICMEFHGAGFEPFFIAHAVCPIGRHFTLGDHRANTTGVATPVTAPPLGLGVPVFA